MRDGTQNKKILWAKVPAAISTDTTTASNIIDRLGFRKLTFVLIAGAWTDGVFTPLVSEADASNMAGENAVADADLTKLEASSTTGAATTQAVDATGKIGYLGSKRYVTCDIVSSDTSSGATVGVLAILEDPDIEPVA